MQPGEHCISVMPDTDEYFVFPEDAGPFCHSWALARKERPDVVAIEAVGLPIVKHEPCL